MSDIRYGRKRKGIRLELRKKIEDWLESITDATVRAAVRRDTIITGGSIASMLLGEPVNDFDVYFRTKGATRLVAEYYVKEFIGRHHDKLGNYTIPYTPEVKEQVIKNIKGIEEDRIVIWLKSAGVASESQTDYRYYELLSEDATVEFAEQTLKDIEYGKDKYRPIFLSQNAITLSNKVQLVVRFYGEPNQIHNNYDFVHATCYYDYGNDELVLPSEALEALLSRTLVYKGSLYPIASVFRTKKFIERGWRITAGQQLKMMWQISEIDLSDVNVMREQLTGVDMAYMWQLIDALQNVDPEKINSTYISTIIDKIFG